MITLEEYQLEYDLYLAEQEMFDSLIMIGSGCINESSELININEGFKETISNYITRIITALEKAWERFKSLMESSANVVFLKSIAKKMENPNPQGIIINNHYNYDLSKLDNIKIIPFNYEEMKDSLESNKDFEDKYYSSYKTDSDKSLKENIIESCYTVQPKVQCTSDMLKNMYKFCTKDFVDKMSNLDRELKTMTASSKNVQALVNTITITKESVLYYKLSVVNEEEKEAKTSFDNPPTAGGENSKIVKQVKTYMSVNTDILSTKMKCYRDIYAYYIKVIKNYINPITEKKEDKK